MRDELIEDDLYNELSGDVARPEEKVGIFDYLLGSYIIAMLATNYSTYNDLVSNIGLAIPVLFVFSLAFSKYHFHREFFVLVALYAWVLLGSLFSHYRLLALASAVFFLKVQFVMLVVALRCTSFRRMRFYLAVVAIATAFLVVPSIFMASYLAIDRRLIGTVGQANALGYITVSAIVAWGSLLFVVRGWWRWILFPVMMVISLYVLLLSGSRGAFVTFVFFVLVISWFIWRRGSSATKIFLPLGLIVSGLILLFFARDLPIIRRLVYLPVALGFEVGISGTGPQTQNIRLHAAKIALGVFSAHPLWGAGYGTFRAYSQFVYTHTTPLDFLYGTGAVGTFLYYFVIATAWRVLAKAKKLGWDNPMIVRNVDICQVLIITQLVAGLAIPNQASKTQAIFAGVWLGIAWYMRSWTKEQLQYQVGYQAESMGDSHFVT